MPQALSTKPEPYQHEWRPGMPYDEIYTGWAYPPKDYAKWAELVYQWVKHCVERYGRAEVEQWYWEVWNEPNIGYWHGTPEEFYKLHDYAIDAVRRALADRARRRTGRRRARRRSSCRIFSSTRLRGKNYATGEIGTPDWISSRFTPRARRRSSTATCAWASPISCATIDRGFARDRVSFPS